MALTKAHPRMMAGVPISVKDFGAVGDGTTDDTIAIQAADAAAEANGLVLVFPNGTYYFTSDLTFDAPVRMEGGVLLGSNTVSFPTNFDADGYYCFRCPTLTVRTFKVNVKWYGARGDNTGDTPGDESIDITSEPWNTWDNTGWKDNVSWSPYGTSGSFVAPRPSGLPFANDDTWDYIGCSRALWASENNAQTTFFPAGTFIINVSSTDSKGSLNGLSIMRDMGHTIEGAGVYETIIYPKEDYTFFNTTSTGSTNAFQLFNIYRTGGPPTHITGMAFVGPTNYTVTSQNLTLIRCQNINGVTFRDLWLSSGDYGIHSTTNGGDSHIKGVTSEYLWRATVYTDSGSDFTIDFCNFWASAVVTGQRGIEADGKVDVRNTRFINFRAQSCLAARGVFQNNYVAVSSAATNVSFTSDALVTGNYMTGSSGAPFVKVGSNSTISDNYFYQTDQHGCIDGGTSSAGTATNLVISGNTFIKTNATAAAQNYAITALDSGVSYTGAATASMFIIGNTFQGRALTSIGSATIKDNIFSGSYTA